MLFGRRKNGATLSLMTSVNSPIDERSARVIAPRGPLSAAVLGDLRGEEHDDHAALAADVVSRAVDLLVDDDVQTALFGLYASFYGSLDELSPDREWKPELIHTRRVLEGAFEAQLRDTVPMPDLPAPSMDAVARALFTLTGEDEGPSLARYIARTATRGQIAEFLVQRSIYTLGEADPHSWAIPRLRGRAKAALVEIQSDEYGGGRPERMHATIFAKTLRAAGLDDAYGAYINAVPAITLASLNTMSMFGLNRRLLGAIVGHLAAFEMTSSIPNRFYGDGLRRVGMGTEATDYFDEHVEADAVHEQIAAHDMAGALAQEHPDMLPDILFGAAACLTVDGRVAAHMLERWAAGSSSLRTETVR